MKYGKLLDIIKSSNIIIPIYVYKQFPKLDIDLETFIFLMYLHSKGNNQAFDINGLSEEFSKDIKTIMMYIATLQDKKLIDIKVIKNDKNIMEEYISLDMFYEKISLLSIEDINKKEEDDSNVFQLLEREIGKQLSTIEIEIVKAWKENGYSDEIIKEAVKEAVLNGVANLRYIDKILYEWAKKGIKTYEDVEKNRKEFRNKEKEKPKKLDLFDYDWIDDDDES